MSLGRVFRLWECLLDTTSSLTPEYSIQGYWEASRELDRDGFCRICLTTVLLRTVAFPQHPLLSVLHQVAIGSLLA